MGWVCSGHALWWVLGALLTTCPEIRANQPGGFSSLVTAPVVFDPAVRVNHTPLVRRNSTTWRNGNTASCLVLDNGILRVLINPLTGTIPSIKYLRPGLAGTPLANGIELVSQRQSLVTTAFGQHTEIFWYGAQPRASGTALRNCDAFFVSGTATGDHVDLGFRWNYDPAKGDNIATDFEVHYVLRRGNAGLYAYVVADHPATYPQAQGGGFTMIWPAANDGDTFTCENHYIDRGVFTGLNRERNGLAPSFDDLDAASFGMADATNAETGRFNTGVFSGLFDVKYAYNKATGDPYYSTWGRASDLRRAGQWIVLGSHEFFGGGPTYTDYVTATGLTYVSMNTTHSENPGFSIPANTAWKKTYGPFLIYLNGLPNGEESWLDAQNQAVAERSAWPYSWLNYQPAFATAAERVTLTGTLALHDPLRPGASASGAWVGVAAPDDGTEGAANHWQFQNAGYQYWVRADANGAFQIPSVRVLGTDGQPAPYKLYAYSEGETPSTGVLGQYASAPFTPTPGANIDFGLVNWQVPHPGSALVFEIGIPNRSAREFKNGNRHARAEIVKEFNSQFTDPLVFTPPSTPAALLPDDYWADKLNYAHSTGYVGSSPEGWRWNIDFNLAAVKPGSYWLNIGYAVANSVQIVKVNGTALPAFTPPNAQVNGSGVLRQYIATKHSIARVAIPSTLLRAGPNTIILAHEVHSNRTRTSFLYDYLNLEEPTPPVLPPGRDLVWKGGISANAWDAVSGNWLVSGSSTPSVAFADGDRPRFDDTGSASPALALSGSLRPGQITFANTTARSYTLTGSGVLAGPFQLLKTGAGTVSVSPYHQLRTASIVSGSAAVNVNTTTGLMPGLVVTTSSASTDFPAGTRILSVDDATTLTLSAKATATRTGVQLGFGTAHTFDGGVVLDGGTLSLSNATANVAGLGAGTVTFNGGTLSLWDSQSTPHATAWHVEVPVGSAGRLNASSRMEFNGALSGGGVLTLYVPWIRTTLNGGWSNFTGNVLVRTDASGGDLRLGNAAGCPLGAIDLGPLVTAYGTLAGYQNLAVGEITGDATSVLTGAGTSVTHWIVGSRQSDFTFAGAIRDGAIPAVTAITKVGAGTWTLSGPCTHTGNTTVSEGRLVLAQTLSGSRLQIDAGAEMQIKGSVTLSGMVVNAGLLDLEPGAVLSAAGGVLNQGRLILRGNAYLNTPGTLQNQGVLDLLTSSAGLPANLDNQGVVLDAATLHIEDFTMEAGTATIGITGQPGHVYQLQRCESLSSGLWTPVGPPQNGSADTTLIFVDSSLPSATARFYRIVIGP